MVQGYRGAEPQAQVHYVVCKKGVAFFALLIQPYYIHNIQSDFLI